MYIYIYKYIKIENGVVNFPGCVLFSKIKGAIFRLCEARGFSENITGTNTVKVSTPPNDHPTIFAKNKDSTKNTKITLTKHVL